MSDKICDVELVGRSGITYRMELTVLSAEMLQQKFRESITNPASTGYVSIDTPEASWTIPFTAIEKFDIRYRKDTPSCL